MIPDQRSLSRSQAERLVSYLAIFETPGYVFRESHTPDRSETILTQDTYDFIRLVLVFAGTNTSERLRLLDLQAYEKDAHLLGQASADLLFELLYRHVRLDHSSRGHLLELLENGHIIAMLKRLRDLQPTLAS